MCGLRAAQNPEPPPWLKEFARVAFVGLGLPMVSTLLWWVHTGSALLFRGWVNVEFLLLLCLALMRPSKKMIALLTAELALSMIEPIAHLYYFSLRDAVFSLRYLILIPAPRLAGYALLLILYIVACAATLRVAIGVHRRPYARKTAVFFAGLVVFLSAFDLAASRHFGTLPADLSLGDLDVRPQHAVRMPLMSLAYGMYSGSSYAAAPAIRSMPSALKFAIDEAGTGSRVDIVLVLTESWGRANDDSLNEMLVKPYRTHEIQSEYKVMQGTVPFLGATTSGETRELCGDPHGRSETAISPGYFSSCWPSLLESRGYRTLAVHGFTPGMFNREQWYRQMGFEGSVFLPELQKDGVDLCDGAFPGACDRQVAAWIGDRLAYRLDRRPMFVHWVTLNSHLPIPVNPEDVHSSDCVSLHIDQQQSLCSWYRRVLLVQEGVAQMALSARTRPAMFVIVGDHAPPFSRGSIRSRFSQTEVPYITLIPRADARRGDAIASEKTTAKLSSWQ